MSYDLSLNDAALQRVPRGGHPLGRGDPLSANKEDKNLRLEGKWSEPREQ